MSVFNWLLMAHLIGDWLLQTEYEATNKAKGHWCNRALVKHCSVYTLTFVPIFLLVNISLWWLTFIFVSHWFIDRRWPVVWIVKTIKRTDAITMDRAFWLVIVVDQVLHVLILALIAGMT